jgi:maleylpyruvate isomerase
MYESREARGREIEDTAGLDPAALRALFDDTAITLDAAWLALPESHWSQEVRSGQGRTVRASATLWMRTRELWVHAIDLDARAGFDALPERMLRRTLADVVTSWGESSGIRVEVAGPVPITLGDDDAEQFVSDTLADITGWATERARTGVTAHDGSIPRAPLWL